MDLPALGSSAKRQRLPRWLVKPFGFSEEVRALKVRLRARGLHTVCEEARCPNLGECWSRKTATFMILGDVCTRHCGFCSVSAGKPAPLDPAEPRKVAEMVALLKLRHVVITCVARDDLKDGGAEHFVNVVAAVRNRQPDCRIEILTTDFGMRRSSMERVCRGRPDVFNHNLETVRRLTPRVRHRATYENSLEFLRRIKEYDTGMTTKSGLMLGLGETKGEVLTAMEDLRAAGCSILTIGQYLRPTTRNLPVVEYVEPSTFEDYEKMGYEMGFESVASGPFVRSSYHAETMLPPLPGPLPDIGERVG